MSGALGLASGSSCMVREPIPRSTDDFPSTSNSMARSSANRPVCATPATWSTSAPRATGPPGWLELHRERLEHTQQPPTAGSRWRPVAIRIDQAKAEAKAPESAGAKVTSTLATVQPCRRPRPAAR